MRVTSLLLFILACVPVDVLADLPACLTENDAREIQKAGSALERLRIYSDLSVKALDTLALTTLHYRPMQEIQIPSILLPPSDKEAAKHLSKIHSSYSCLIRSTIRELRDLPGIKPESRNLLGDMLYRTSEFTCLLRAVRRRVEEWEELHRSLEASIDSTLDLQMEIRVALRKISTQ